MRIALTTSVAILALAGIGCNGDVKKKATGCADNKACGSGEVCLDGCRLPKSDPCVP